MRRGPLTLRAPRLKLQETDAGVSVEGPGRLSGCSCEAPPVELGFERADISQEGDVDLSGPRIMSGDTTLFYLPRLALRGPNSAGLLPPRLGYSGRDGGFLGVGAEVPVGGARGTEPTRVRFGAGAYSRFQHVADGARLELDVSAPSGRAHAAWESLEGGLLDIDAHGAARSSDSGVSYRVDAARGRRATLGPLLFARVIAPQDRARLSVASWGAPGISGYAQLRSDAIRGETYLEGVNVGAASGFAVDLAEGDAWRVGWEGDVLGLGGHQREQLGVFRQVLGVQTGAALGPLAVSTGVQSALVMRAGELTLGSEAPQVGAGAPEDRQLAAQARGSLALPLSRRFERWRHWVEPRLEVAGQVGVTPWVQGEAALAQRFGGAARGEPEATLELAAGVLHGDLSSEVDARYIRGEMLAGGRWVGVSASSVALVNGDGWSAGGAMAQGAQLRLGRETGLHVRGVFEQALGYSWHGLYPGSQALGGTALDAPSAAPWASPYAALGTSAGGELWLPLGARWATSVSSVFDLGSRGSSVSTAPTWLFGSWGGAYRHPCGCLALQAQLSHRLGRHTGFDRPLQAFDAWLALELFEAPPAAPPTVH